MIWYPWEIEGPKYLEILTIIEKVLKKKKFQRGNFFQCIYNQLMIYHQDNFNLLMYLSFLWPFQNFILCLFLAGCSLYMPVWNDIISRVEKCIICPICEPSFWTLVFNVFFPMFVWILWLGLEANNSVVRTNLLLK